MTGIASLEREPGRSVRCPGLLPLGDEGSGQGAILGIRRASVTGRSLMAGSCKHSTAGWGPGERRLGARGKKEAAVSRCQKRRVNPALRKTAAV
ncbi:hypothetical protein [Streptomyces sp. NPDC012746]|uniref:hypothetical protein n=1 Tax=Streptomyces sp. NPDC012746 TaxID=3364845 RepID=UPI003680B1B7